MKIFVILPTYNEQDNIKNVIQDIMDLSLDVGIVHVDDGSTDKTVEVVDSLNLKNVITLKHIKNQGLGCAIKTGFDYCLENRVLEDVVVTMDCDQSHPAIIIKDFLREIEQGADCVIASRFVKGGKEIGVNFLRKLLSRGLRILIKLLYKYKVNDYSSGFRMYKVSAIKKLRDIYGKDYIKEKGFVCMSEILLKLLKLNLNIKEVPLILRYDLKQGASKIKILKTISGHIKNLFKQI